MRVGFVVNGCREPSAEQTTTLLMAAALRRGHEVSVLGVGDFGVSPDGGLFGNALNPASGDPATLCGQLRETKPRRVSLDGLDLCVVRTNPGRDSRRRAEHTAALRLLELLEERGVPVINGARGLSRALTKLSLLGLPPSMRPETLVSRDPSEIEKFVEQHAAPVVIKPAEGTRGRDVFVLRASRSDNTKQIIDVVLRQGYAMVQEFVPGAERGDVRVTVVDGRILETAGCEAAVARIPGKRDFRSNIHAGGTAAPYQVTASMREAVVQMAPLLAREGLVHVGVDFVGDVVLELNVFSPGGLHPGERLYGCDFSGAVIEAFEDRVRPS